MGYIIPNYLHSFFGNSILCGYNINSFEIELLGSDDINDKNNMEEFIKNIFGEKLSSFIDDKFYEISLDNDKKNIIWDIDLPDKFSRVFQDKNCDKSKFSEFYWLPKKELYSSKFLDNKINLYNEKLIAKPYKISKKLYNIIDVVKREKHRIKYPLKTVNKSGKNFIQKNENNKKISFLPRKAYKRKN